MRNIFSRFFKKELSPEDAHRILADVPEEHHFYANDGRVIKNLYDLADAVRNMDYETYSHHANTENNDFVTWIKDIHKDNHLVRNLSKIEDKEDFALRLRSRLMFLELLADKKPIKEESNKKKFIVIE